MFLLCVYSRVDIYVESLLNMCVSYNKKVASKTTYIRTSYLAKKDLVHYFTWGVQKQVTFADYRCFRIYHPAASIVSSAENHTQFISYTGIAPLLSVSSTNFRSHRGLQRTNINSILLLHMCCFNTLCPQLLHHVNYTV